MKSIIFMQLLNKNYFDTSIIPADRDHHLWHDNTSEGWCVSSDGSYGYMSPKWTQCIHFEGQHRTSCMIQCLNLSSMDQVQYLLPQSSPHLKLNSSWCSLSLSSVLQTFIVMQLYFIFEIVKLFLFFVFNPGYCLAGLVFISAAFGWEINLLNVRKRTRKTTTLSISRKSGIKN